MIPESILQAIRAHRKFSWLPRAEKDRRQAHLFIAISRRKVQRRKA